jgi:hypothetical protein
MENNQQDIFNPEQPQEQVKRTNFLTTICILSFIGSGFAILGGLIYTLLYDSILDIFAAKDDEMYQAMYDSLANLPKTYFLSELFLSIASLVGVLFMWRMRKIGFHIYTVANILVLGLPLFFGVGSFNYVSLLFITGPFIAMYAVQLKNMR